VEKDHSFKKYRSSGKLKSRLLVEVTLRRKRLPSSPRDCLHHQETACITKRLLTSRRDCLHHQETACVTKRMPASPRECLHHQETACVTKRLPASPVFLD
jgi:hypothetical protein